MSAYKKECNPHIKRGKGKIIECSCCNVVDYCLDYSIKFDKVKPFYMCKFCYTALLRDVSGSLHKLYNLPRLKK